MNLSETWEKEGNRICYHYSNLALFDLQKNLDSLRCLKLQINSSHLERDGFVAKATFMEIFLTFCCIVIRFSDSLSFIFKF